MRRAGTIVLATLVAAGAVGLRAAQAPPGITRTPLMQEDLSTPGREAVQVLVEGYKRRRAEGLAQPEKADTK